METELKTQASGRDWLAYVVPMALFLLMTALLEAQFPKLYPTLYMAKVVVVTLALAATVRIWRQDLQPAVRVLPVSVFVGLAIFVVWIGVDSVTPHLAFLGKRSEFNPFKEIADPNMRGLFLVFRAFGLVAMVPIMEELFWRSFLLRFITKENFREVPIGDYSLAAFAVVAVGFALAHPEWLAALLCAIALALLLRFTRSLYACIIAHAVANLALGIYVIQTGQWRFW